MDYKEQLKYMLWGYLDCLYDEDLEMRADSALQYLKWKANNEKDIKELFDDEFENCYYDIDKDEIVYTEEQEEEEED